MKYDSNVSTLEDWDNIKLMTVDEIHGIFTSYEMRTRQNGSSKKEATFKALSKNQSENLYDEESLFHQETWERYCKIQRKATFEMF